MKQVSIHQVAPDWLSFFGYKPYRDCTLPPMGGGLDRNPEFALLLDNMRSFIPVEGTRDWVKDIGVLIKPGEKGHQGQRMHAHEEWTAVLYIQPAGVPIYVKNEFEVDRITPQPLDVVVLEPNTVHWVGPNDSDQERLSFAMLVPPPGVVSKFQR